MKLNLQTLCTAAATLILHSCSPAPVYAAAPLTLKYTAETSAAQPYRTTIWQGETVDLEATLRIYGAAVALPGNAVATLWYQTNGMASAWWRGAATATTGGVLTAHWTPALDVGAPAYTFYIGVADASTQTLYRAHGQIKMMRSPGFVPNSIDLPARLLDFDALAVTNAPWATPADVAAATNGIPQPDFSPYLRRDASQEVPYGWALKLLGTGSIYNYGELRQIGLDVGTSTEFSSYRAGKITVAPNAGTAQRTITLPYTTGTMALLADITAATNSEAIIRAAGDAAGSNYVESIRGVFPDIATNVVYHVVVSNGHWLIQEVQ
jgi:hypothetical protein